MSFVNTAHIPQNLENHFTFCNYKATKQTNLKTHQLSVHTKVRYTCQVCKFGDSQVSRVKLHEQRKHEIFQEEHKESR